MCIKQTMHFLHYSPSPVCSPCQVGRGEAEGACRQPILILHGRGGSSASREKIGQWLADAWHEIRIPDLAGHGQTPLPHAYTIDDYITDVVDFIQQTIHHAGNFLPDKGGVPNEFGTEGLLPSAIQNPQSLIIIAHSNGGRIALHLASTHPDLVSQLILINSAWVDLSYDPSRYRTIKRAVLPPLAKLCKKIFSPLLAKREGEGWGVRSLYRLLGWHDYLATAHDRSLRETFVTMLHTYIENDMQNIDTQTIATTLIRWWRDSYTPLRQGKRMHHLIAWSKLIVYPNEKHGIHLHNPTLLIKKLKELITTR